MQDARGDRSRLLLSLFSRSLSFSSLSCVCLRIPSYTDRILWRPSSSISLLRYDSVDSVRSSDHRPVYATFRIKIRQREQRDEDKLKKWMNGAPNGSRACVVQ